jgi:hypothetical protein
MHGLACQTSSTYFFRITHAEEEGLADSQCRMENSSRALWLLSFGSKELLPIMAMVFGRMIYHGP